MTVSQLNNSVVPPGPEIPHDINVTERDFFLLGEWLDAYGDIFQVTQATRKDPLLVINHPDAIKHVLVTNSKNYVKGVGFELVKMLLGNGIIVSDGAFWWRQRRMIQPAFNKKVVAELTQQIKQINFCAIMSYIKDGGSRICVDRYDIFTISDPFDMFRSATYAHSKVELRFDGVT